MNWFVVFVGGGVGSVARYALSIMLNGRGTIVANVTGCFLIGLLGALSSRMGWGESTRLMLTVGLCGGFTTFSTFSSECLSFIKDGNWLAAALYIAASVVLGIVAVFIGWWIGAASSRG